MKDVFGTAQNQLILTAAERDDGTVVKKDKKEKTNMVKVYLASIPNLEAAKDALTEISESTADGPVKAKIDEFIASILKITEEILDLTKVAVRGVRAEATEATEATGNAPARPTITPDMISGREPIPKA
jgi:hypothetical protein